MTAYAKPTERYRRHVVVLGHLACQGPLSSSHKDNPTITRTRLSTS
ncbi:hypothetical protein [Fodinicola acaciae]|nr:hypothetical protein [Fodinicola acaciae]